MDKKSSISVIIPTYNNAAYIEEAIDSVLGQTISVDEIIVIDDGSTDHTMQLLHAYNNNITYQYQNNAGAAAARNKGIALSKGDILVFLDADDIWVSTKIAEQLSILNKRLDIDMVFGHIEQFISPDTPAEIKKKILCPSTSQKGFLPTTLMIRKDGLEKVGDFNTSLAIGEFIDWYGLAKDKGLTHYLLPSVVAKRRLHANNSSTLNNRQDYLTILKKRLDKKRKITS